MAILTVNNMKAANEAAALTLVTGFERGIDEKGRPVLSTREKEYLVEQQVRGTVALLDVARAGLLQVVEDRKAQEAFLKEMEERKAPETESSK